jgi:hypothetical protein
MPAVKTFVQAWAKRSTRRRTVTGQPGAVRRHLPRPPGTPLTPTDRYPREPAELLTVRPATPAAMRDHLLQMFIPAVIASDNAREEDDKYNEEHVGTVALRDQRTR